MRARFRVTGRHLGQNPILPSTGKNSVQLSLVSHAPHPECLLGSQPNLHTCPPTQIAYVMTPLPTLSGCHRHSCHQHHWDCEPAPLDRRCTRTEKGQLMAGAQSCAWRPAKASPPPITITYITTLLLTTVRYSKYSTVLMQTNQSEPVEPHASNKDIKDYHTSASTHSIATRTVTTRMQRVRFKVRSNRRFMTQATRFFLTFKFPADTANWVVCSVQLRCTPSVSRAACNPSPAIAHLRQAHGVLQYTPPLA